MAAGVFISFRPEDAAWAARIRDRLRSRPERELTERVGEARAIVLIIGKTWLAKPIDDPKDPVRVAIETALEGKIRVIPTLVDGALLPRAEALPEMLKPLALLHPIMLSSQTFDFDFERLNDALRQPTDWRRIEEIARRTTGQVKNLWGRLTDDESIVGSLDPFALPDRPRGAAIKPARKRAAKTPTPKRAGRKGAARRTAARKTVTKKAAANTKAPQGAATKRPTAKKTAAKKPAAKKAAKPAPVEQDVAPGPLHAAANKDLSVDAMKHFALARRTDPKPNEERQRAGSESALPAGAAEQIVECSVFGPPAAPPGKTILIQVFLHLADQAERARFLATTMDASAKEKGAKPLDLPVKRGARVEIAFSANGLAVDEPVQSVVWRGEPTFCQFLTTIPAGTSGQSFLPVVRVSVDGKLIGRIAFSLSSDDAASQPTSGPLGDHAKPYKYAFVSYASKDRKEVLKRVQMLEVLKTKFFQDILSLDPGDRWERKLYENIDRCDLFLLFWSQAAKDLQWVLKEAEYALAHQRKNPGSEPDLVPVVLEQNVLPPPNLSAFHFNDRISYLISRKL